MPGHAEVMLLDSVVADRRQPVAWGLPRYTRPVSPHRIAAGAEVSLRDAAQAGWAVCALAFNAPVGESTAVACPLTQPGRDGVEARLGIPPCRPIQVRRGW
jgi:hypothetical protein